MAHPAKAGGRPAAARRTPAAGSRMLDEAEILARLEAGEFPPTLYLEGPDEALKAALLAEIRHAWARRCPEAPHARVFRAAEAGAEEILASFHGTSLFTPRELILVLDLEGLGRSERAVRALAEGLSRPSGGSCLVLVESAAESPRKSLDAVRAAAAAHCVSVPLGRGALVAWGRRRLDRENIEAEEGLVEMLADACEDNPAELFNELDKLIACAGKEGRLSRELAATLLRPVVGADLREYLAAVAAGDAARAARCLGRVLTAGAGEGTVLFALANLVGGALGGWSRHRDLSLQMARRARPADLVRALDALYRAESAWKRGRADVVAVLEQATRVASGASTA